MGDAVTTVQQVHEFYRWVDLTGVFANAVLGGIVARGERLDPIGFGTLAIASGLGGGMIRDTLLQAGTPVALTDPRYILVALLGAAIAYVADVGGRTWDRIYPYVDAVALGTWAATGAAKTLDVGLGWLPAVLLGTITAVGGGVVRDVLMRRIPAVLGGGTLYATCALVASGVMVLAYQQDHRTLGTVAATAVGGGLCLLARWRNWVLPPGAEWRPPRPDRIREVVVLNRGFLRSRRRPRPAPESDGPRPGEDE